MSETLVEQAAAAQVSPEQQQIQAEIAKNMAINLNGGIEPKKEEAAPAEQQQAQVVVDHFGVLKEKYQYQSPDDAIREIEELRQFKATPREDFKFENEESAKLFKAWQGGKKSEVYNYLKQDQEIDVIVNKDVNKDTAADIVKLGMQIKYKDLTPDEINYKFNKQFAIPPKPTQGIEEEEADYKNRLANWESIATDKQMELLIEAKLAKPEVAASKSKLVFPELHTEDDGYAQYKKMLSEQAQNQEQVAKIEAETIAAYKAFTPKNVETKINFKDEANKIDFDFTYEPDAKDFAKAVELASDIDQFFKLFHTPDGKPDRQRFLKVLAYAINPEREVMEAIKQAKNATIKAGLPDNSQGGLVRQIAQSQQPLSEVDKLAKQAGII